MLLSRRAETSRRTTYFVYTNLFSGTIGVPCVCVGILVGGALMKKLNFSSLQAINLCVEAGMSVQMRIYVGAYVSARAREGYVIIL